MKYALLALAASATSLAPAIAQTTASAITTPESAPISEVPTTNAVLRAGTPVALKMMEEVTTKHKAAKVGQRFQLEVAAPVEVNGVTVIPVGTPAWGQLTGVRNKGMWGKSGKLDAELLYLRVNGRQIRLSGTFDDKGTTGTAGVVGSVALVPLAGFFMTGTSASLPMGGPVNGFIDEDVQLALPNKAPAPMVVPAAQPAMAVAPSPTPAAQTAASPTATAPAVTSHVRCDTCRP